MDIEVVSVDRLRFADGAPVRAASAVVGLGDGFLVVSDDATHAAWFRGGSLESVESVRLVPPVEGHDLFSEPAGTKHLKPDFEAAVPLTVDGVPAALVLGSGSSAARMRWVLLLLEPGGPRAVARDLSPLYARVAAALSVDLASLNLEGACVVGEVLRWYHRGLPSAGQPSASVDLDLGSVVAAVRGDLEPASLAVAAARTYDLGSVDGVGLAVTDVVALPDGSLLASVAAEDSPNPRDDGPVVASGLARLEGAGGFEVARLPLVEGAVVKVEGLMVLEADGGVVDLLAVADLDDPEAASLALRLRLRG